VAACRDRERLRFDYRSHDGTEARRDVEPYRLVNWGRRWYLVAYDVERADWRTFRVDRISPRTPTGPRFAARPLPADDLATYVSRGVGAASWRYRATVVVHAPAERIAERLPVAVGTVVAIDETTCSLSTGSDSAEMMAAWLGMLDADFEVIDSPELAEALRRLSARFAAAAGPTNPAPPA
jgi:predicted DNA-binding transcriptional regulator YafY